MRPVLIALAGGAALLLLTLQLPASPIEDLVPDSTSDDDPAIDPERVSWRRLDFKASKLFVSARTQVELAEVEPGVAEITFDTQVLGRRNTDAVRFQMGNADSRTRHKQKHGKHPYAKFFRYGDELVTMVRSEPADIDEATADSATWSHRKHHEFGAPPPGCEVVVDPSVILYLAAARTWSAGQQPVSFCTFSDEKFSRLVIQAAGEEDLRVDYDVEQPDGALARHQKTVKALLLKLDVEPLDGEGKDQLEVLGLEDDICMYVDPETGAPIRFTGKMESLGRVEVELQRLVLR